MEKLLSGDLGTLLLFAGAFILALVGVMSILLPILVFKILSEISDTNKKLSRILTLLSEGTRENRSPSQPQRQPEEIYLGPTSAPQKGSAEIGEKPLRFQ
jgi:hypothetical protein